LADLLFLSDFEERNNPKAHQVDLFQSSQQQKKDAPWKEYSCKYRVPFGENIIDFPSMMGVGVF
jgi:hypothetical protein